MLTDENVKKYDDVVEILKTHVITSPIYFIVSGRTGNEGTVIERDPESMNAMYTLNETTWFLVQTNYDRSKVDPFYDRRRYPAEDVIRAIGKDITLAQLFNNVLVQYPTFNILTIYSVTMVNTINYHNITCWYGVNPSVMHSLEIES